MQVLAASPVPTIWPVGQAAKQAVPALFLRVPGVVQAAHTGGSAVLGTWPAPHLTHWLPPVVASPAKQPVLATHSIPLLGIIQGYIYIKLASQY